MRKRIACVIGDAGSANYFLPALPHLELRYDITILTDPAGAGQKVLQKAGVEVMPTETISDLSGFDLVLCGTAGKAARLWRDATIEAQKADISVLWFGDFFGAGGEEIVRDLSPTWFAAFDESTKEQFIKLRPDFPQEGILVVGNPAFDNLSTLRTQDQYIRGRTTLGLESHQRHVHYSASSMKQFDLYSTAELLVHWAKGEEVFMSVSFHPADKNEPAELNSLQNLFRELGPFYKEAELTKEQAVASCDAFITDYSTTGVEAMIAGAPTAFVMLNTAQMYQESRGGEFPFFPILADSNEPMPAVGIFSPHQIDRLDWLFDPTHKAGMLQAQREGFPSLTWNASLRFCELVAQAVATQ